ncbi:MAG: preprotein translocase subunit SecA [Nitrospirae bacterium]|nr:preprotein translocase subunit SecA [Candidatus Troglogloeales bacterium]
MFNIFRKIIGSRNDREVKRLWPIVMQVNEYESIIAKLSDAALREKTTEFKNRFSEGNPDDSDSSNRLWDALPEVFAVAREAAKRVVSMRPFDVQVLGGIALHSGKISEMKTGEGKTLVGTMPAYLNALTGRGVHVITVNDYLAKRDAQWMGEIYRFLGLSVGIIQHDSTDKERREAYHADIIYGTNNEFGFDYLRDNMKFDPAHFVQRPLYYAIVDEVDSILIDEARTPLIISGPAEESTELYFRINQIIPHLVKEKDFTIEEKTKTAAFTEEGNAHLEKLLGVENLYDMANMEMVHHALQALKAHALYRRDVEYMIKDGEVIIVDEFTGRLMPGRRWSDGLHQAVEAKEGVKIANENQTLASVTFQNYFRMYKKLSGMTGTADTEAAEFDKIYNLEVMVIPPNRTMIRQDDADLIYRTEKEKFDAIVEELKELADSGHPVLVGTISIEKSEHLSSLLKRRGVKHSVLNAKYHEKEAEIIAQAGRFGAVTIATNMAGRGTDILLGGNPDFLFKHYKAQHPDAEQEALLAAKEKIQKECEAEKARVIALGGLRIIGTERHESRRVDNQLRGRAGRQGDPGSSRFYLSLEDDLLRIFGSERISKVMTRLGMEEGVPIEHRMVTRAIENAQKRVEGHNFDIRKHLLEYDDVMNKQRTLVYGLRNQAFSENRLSEIEETIHEMVEADLENHCPKESYSEEWDIENLALTLSNQFNMPLSKENLSNANWNELKDQIISEVTEAYSKKEHAFGAEDFHHLEKQLFLRMIDAHWKDHLLGMDYLKEGIGLRGYGQKEPLSEYKREGFDMFMAMIDRIKRGAVEQLFRVQPPQETVTTAAKKSAPAAGDVPSQKFRTLQLGRGEAPQPQTPVTHKNEPKIGRNDPCNCGSGKKYKKCCGR